jgi:hypothetical protein
MQLPCSIASSSVEGIGNLSISAYRDSTHVGVFGKEPTTEAYLLLMFVMRWYGLLFCLAQLPCRGLPVVFCHGAFDPRR